MEHSNFVIMSKNEVAILNDMYKRIEALCKTRGINITQMCREAEIARGNLTDLKKGRTTALSTKTLQKLSLYFGVPMERLLGAEQQPGEYMSNLYSTIFELCAKKGISGYRLCKDVGIQPSLLTDLKMGRQKCLSAKNMEKVASYFGVSVSFLLGAEEEKKPAGQAADELNAAGYYELNEENRAVIDSLIAKLLKSQSDK